MIYVKLQMDLIKISSYLKEAYETMQINTKTIWAFFYLQP